MNATRNSLALMSIVALAACSGGGGSGSDDQFLVGGQPYAEFIAGEPNRSFLEEVRNLDVSGFDAVDPAQLPSTAVMRGSIYYQPINFRHFESPRAFGKNVAIGIDFSADAVYSPTFFDGDDDIGPKPTLVTYALVCPSGADCAADTSAYILGDVIATQELLSSEVLQISGMPDPEGPPGARLPLNQNGSFQFYSESYVLEMPEGYENSFVLRNGLLSSEGVFAMEDGKLIAVGEAVGSYSFSSFLVDEFGNRIGRPDDYLQRGRVDVRLKIGE